MAGSVVVEGQAARESVGGASLPITLRPMREGDIPAVMAIERRSFPSPWPESAYRYELVYGLDSSFFVLQIAKEESPAATWRDRLRGVLERQGEPPLLGYVGLRFRGNGAHIITIAVHPEWRRMGLGEFLLLAALEEAARRSVQRITLEVRPSNQVAQRLYEKAGFSRKEVRRAYYRDGENAWVMVLHPLDDANVARLRDLRRALETRLMTERLVATGRE